jgi:hypothetical protein
MRWTRDETDLWCEQWARERRKYLGITELEPKDRIGRLSCTLGAVKEEGEGACQGTVTQRFPEHYTGTALLVNRAWKAMNQNWRPVLEVHYVYAGKGRVKAQAVGLSTPMYWRYLGFAKNYIHAFVTIGTDQQTEKITQTQNSHAQP